MLRAAEDGAHVNTVSPSRRGRRLAAAVFACISIILVASYLAASYVVADRFSQPARVPVDRPPLVQAASYEDVAFTSDGLILRGWLFPGQSDRAVIVVHGRGANRTEWHGRSERIADFLLADGYSVLLFDLRGHGESDGERFSLGYYERRDIAAAIAFLGQRGFAEQRIALIGISMGAASALSVLTIDPNVGPIVVDSSFTDAAVVLAEDLPAETGMPSALVPGILLVERLAFGVDTAAVRPIDIVRAHHERPFLFIHCERDETIAVHHGRELRAASANPSSELWIAPGCLHPRASDDYPDEYREHVLAFLRSQLREMR